MGEHSHDDNINERHQWLKRYVPLKLPHYLMESNDDVVQDVMMKLMKADKRAGETVKNFGYMKQTVMSVIIDYIRKHKTHQSQESEFDEAHEMYQLQKIHSSPEQLVHHQSLLEHVYLAIGQLSELRQTTLMLYLRGMKIREIAEILQMNITKVRNEVYRGKSEIIKILNAQGVNYEV